MQRDVRATQRKLERLRRELVGEQAKVDRAGRLLKRWKHMLCELEAVERKLEAKKIELEDKSKLVAHLDRLAAMTRDEKDLEAARNFVIMGHVRKIVEEALSSDNDDDDA